MNYIYLCKTKMQTLYLNPQIVTMNWETKTKAAFSLYPAAFFTSPCLLIGTIKRPIFITSIIRLEKRS